MNENITSRQFDGEIKKDTKVFDTETSKTESIKDFTNNSILVTQTKTSAKGINCDNWFEEQKFKKRFRVL